MKIKERELADMGEVRGVHYYTSFGQITVRSNYHSVKLPFGQITVRSNYQDPRRGIFIRPHTASFVSVYRTDARLDEW